MSTQEKIFNVLSSVLRDGAYINIAVQEVEEAEDKALVVKTVYGTVENYFSLSYFISTLVQTPPKAVVKVIMLQAIYMLKFLSVPPYAVVNEAVELTKKLGKREQAGFVNAVLKKAAQTDIPTPPQSDTRYLEVKYNLPSWLIAAVKKEYPKNFDAILSAKPREEEHIRLGKGITPEEFEKQTGATSENKTDVGYFVKNTSAVKKLFDSGKITYQSYTSIKAVDAFGEISGKRFLDVCSAPGGKAVLAAGRGALVTACDIHPHRVNLIKVYAKRMGERLITAVADATMENTAFADLFDCVLADVPCSGLGAINRRRDIIFKRSLDDVKNLAGIQYRILECASKAVKTGGILVYSTCTILTEENRDVIDKFLYNHKDFLLEFDKQYLQNSNGMDGFYVARLKKI